MKRWLVVWLVGVPAAIAELVALLLLRDDPGRWLWALPVVPAAALAVGGALWFALTPGVSR